MKKKIRFLSDVTLTAVCRIMKAENLKTSRDRYHHFIKARNQARNTSRSLCEKFKSLCIQCILHE